MDSYQAAIGREVGKVDTDSGGLARYFMKLQVPPGINSGNEPELSLQYCQGCPNGIVGLGWALGGVSAIRRAPSTLAYDGANVPPADFDRFQSKLTLDGVELLNVKGSYGTPGAEYTTEIDSIETTVSHLESGFLVKDALGRRVEYGNTTDSQVPMSSGKKEIREWRLKNQFDSHGNAMTFKYIKSPEGDSSTSDVNTCYLSSIRYSSNEKTGHPGGRIVLFEYSPRKDRVVQSMQGDKVTWAHLLTAIRFGVIRDSNTRIDRSYNLAYSPSNSTGDSILTSVTESTGNGDAKIDLLPSTFRYTTPGLPPEEIFKTEKQTVTRLEQTTKNVALFTMNISGRSLPDIACIRYDQAAQSMTVKTYLATRNPDGTIEWNKSRGLGAEAALPTINISHGFPNILCPDLNKDGRSDLIVPYRDQGGMVSFSLSQSIGTGFQESRTKKTDFEWTDRSKFIAADLSGLGTIDIIQIFKEGEKLVFRKFPSVAQNGGIDLQEPTTTHTNFEEKNTIDWFLLDHASTGAKSLVRVWAQDAGEGLSQITATPFIDTKRDDSGTELRAGESSPLGSPSSITGIKINVLPCDINGDGTQDVVLATAEYVNDEMITKYSVFLGDGHGGYQQHGTTISRTVQAPAPLESTEYGRFYTTNLNGSNYPSLSYVYQERDKKDYICISVDGCSDGSVDKAVQYRLAGDMPSQKMDIVPTDLNGSGNGDWLFHTMDDDEPKVVPIYNRAGITDYLASAQDPMGLYTTLTYGSLTDPKVYTPPVSWENYNNDSEDGSPKDSYPVLGAPNHVVTALEHRNNSKINRFEYRVVIEKTYASARVNTRGRGWQAFGEIHTVNITDNIRTTEKYNQIWPFTGMKSQIDTKSPENKVLMSEKISYEKAFIVRGPWKIYRTNKILEQKDMLDGDNVDRSNRTFYEYDVHGSIITQASKELQHDKVVSQSWKRFTYTEINGITGLITSKKLSSAEVNTDMKLYQDGDASLILYEYDPIKATLRSMSEWSTDVGSFAVKTFVFNEYGNEVESTDAVGLKKTTTYDDDFKSFPVKVSETGQGVSSTQMSAFDEASGKEVARLEENGLLTCYRMDKFGRIFETRQKGTNKTDRSMTAADFFASRPFLADSSLSTILAGCHLDPYRELKFERRKFDKDTAYICASALLYHKDGVDGQTELVEFMDCAKHIRKRSSRHAADREVTWRYWAYDSRGHRTFESFPAKISESSNIDMTPDISRGARSNFDALGRPTVTVRPAHGDAGHFIVTSMAYLDGGARIQEKTLKANSGENPLVDATTLCQVERRYIRIGEDDHIVESTDESGHRSMFQHDVSGHLVLCTDPAGQTEHRTYNSHGHILTLNNPYQNTALASTAAVTYQYNAGQQLISQVNAVGEIVKFQRDAKGRPLQKVGNDGRTVVYEYDRDGSENLSSVTIYPQGPSSPLESRVEYTYDHHGRIKDRKLILADKTSYTTSLMYDWQDQVVQKVLPNGAVCKNEYRGALLRTSSLTGPDSTWVWNSTVPQYNASENPEKLNLQGSGMARSFDHEWNYDAQGVPMKHSLSTSAGSLVQEHYIYNDLSQMARKHDFLSGATTDYLYDGRRLASSQSANGPMNSYQYDTAGNLLQKAGTTIAYSPGRAVGTKNGASVVDITYDAAGRMTKRTTEHSAHEFKYDGFGSLKSYTDTAQGTSVGFVADFNGETLQRQNSDGSSEIFVSHDFSISIQPDGSRKLRHKFLNAELLLATLTDAYGPKDSTRALGGDERARNVHFTDVKGNVTHMFKGLDQTLLEKFDYDDFGLLESKPAEAKKADLTSTYEGKRLDKTTDLIDFGARWYDPLIGRFATPDDILDADLLVRTDGLNRYAFENNDPINHTDPTGHWSKHSIIGAVIGAVMVVAAIAITIATGGAAAPLIAAGVGALAAGGAAGLAYSIEHKDETNAGKFWGGFATTVLINAAIGAATGALGAVATPARAASASARLAAKAGWDLSKPALNTAGKFASLGGKALLGGATAVLTKATERGVSNMFYGTHHDLFENFGSTFGTGAAMGAAFGVFGLKGESNPNKLMGINKFSGSFQLKSYTGFRSIIAPKPTNPWREPDILTVLLKAAKPASKLASVGYTAGNGNDKMKTFLSDFKRANG